jgi:hypothetical protein
MAPVRGSAAVFRGCSVAPRNNTSKRSRSAASLSLRMAPACFPAPDCRHERTHHPDRAALAHARRSRHRGASFLADLGHEVPTALLPNLLTATLGAPAAALGLIEGIANGSRSEPGHRRHDSLDISTIDAIVAR